LGRFHVAAGKFPLGGHVAVVGPPAYQHPAVHINQRTGNYKKKRLRSCLFSGHQRALLS
jgi:hypothetical protein